MKALIILLIATLISIWLIREACWYGYEKLIIGSIIGLTLLTHILVSLITTPTETFANNSFLGAEPSGIIIEIIPGIILWGIISIFRIIRLKVRD